MRFCTAQNKNAICNTQMDQYIKVRNTLGVLKNYLIPKSIFFSQYFYIKSIFIIWRFTRSYKVKFSLPENRWICGNGFKYFFKWLKRFWKHGTCIYQLNPIGIFFKKVRLRLQFFQNFMVLLFRAKRHRSKMFFFKQRVSLQYISIISFSHSGYQGNIFYRYWFQCTGKHFAPPMP